MKRQYRLARSFVTGLFVANAVVSALLLWALYIGIGDVGGWNFLVTWPIYLAALIFAVIDVILFILLAIRRPVEKPRHAFLYWLGAIAAVTPILVTISYQLISIVLHRAAETRASTLITLQEAQQLVSECKVDTLYRNVGGGAQMKLRGNALALPGARAMDERRKLRVEDFDQIVSIARDKATQDKCGYLPTYDINRVKLPAVNKWISIDEAKAIICTRSWLVHLYDSSYFPYTVPEASNSSAVGILLSKKPSVWNDDEESNIMLINTSQEVKNSLQDTFNPSLKRCL